MEMARDMIAAPVSTLEQKIVQSPAIRCVNHQQSVRRKFPVKAQQRGARIAQMFDELAHNDDIVPVVAERAQIGLDVALDHSDLGGFGGFESCVVELQIQANGLNIGSEDFLYLDQAHEISAADVHNGTDGNDAGQPFETLRVLHQLVLNHFAVEIDRR